MSTATDREILESAAKAAGMAAPLFWQDGTLASVWNSLANDDDAFCLQVSMGIPVMHGNDFAVAYCGKSVAAKQVMVWYEGNPRRATRRAITLAAAEIGWTK